MNKESIKQLFPGIHHFYRESKFFARTLFIRSLRYTFLSSDSAVTRLGSQHGWTFVQRDYLENCTLISVGLGEDASFDIEFINRYNAFVYILDPTPRSVSYFHEILSNCGRTKTAEYVIGWRQPIESYDLTRVSSKNFNMIPKALWVFSGVINMYSPKNLLHNDYSITNLQKTTDSLSLPCLTFRDLLEEIEIDIDSVGILKLDIEGAGTEVLANIIGDGFRPRQILVEFEEIFVFSFRNLRKLRSIVTLLKDSGYLLIYSDHVANFTYEYQGKMRA